MFGHTQNKTTSSSHPRIASLLSLAAVVLCAGAISTASAKNYSETILYDFTGQSDGNYPAGGLVRDSAGNLYGTTSVGGYGCGTVFEISAAGVFTALHEFTGGNDGCNS